MSTVQIHALIPAAGQGTRFGGPVLKQYLPVNGIAVLAHAIRAFLFHPQISGVTVVLSENDQLFDHAVGTLGTSVDKAPGGATRTESVRNGLQSISAGHAGADWVLVHDAARPCLPPDCLDKLLEQGLQSPDGAILAVPVSDTLKREGEPRVIDATVDRQGLWAAQTPQLFPLPDLITAIDAAVAAGHACTDEASAMEFSGRRPRLVMGSAANIKITRPGDLALAEAWLKSQ